MSVIITLHRAECSPVDVLQWYQVLPGLDTSASGGWDHASDHIESAVCQENSTQTNIVNKNTVKNWGEKGAISESQDALLEGVYERFGFVLLTKLQNFIQLPE